MTDIEDRLRAAMHAAVDDEKPPGDLTARVMRRHRRRNVLLTGAATLAAVAIAVAAVITLPRIALGPGPASSSHHSTPQPTSPAPTSPAPTPSSTPHKRAPAKLTGLPMPPGTNLRILLNTRNGKTAWYSTATRQTEPVAGLRGGYLYSRAEGGWTAADWLINLKHCGTYPCPGPPVQAYFIADGSLAVTRIGAGFQVQAADRAGAVWLVSYPRSTDNVGTTPADAQLVSTSGRPLSPRYRLPAGYWLVRGVGSYLLLHYLSRSPGYELWDPRTGRVVRRVDNLIAAGPNQIAWSPGCRTCQAQVLNVMTGKSVTIPVPGQLSGIFSDDGKLLALQLPSHSNCHLSIAANPNCSGTSGALDVFDTQTGAVTMIPGTTLRINVPESFLWQDGGHQLLIRAGTQLAYWQPGDTRLRVATIHLPGTLVTDWQY